MSEEMLLGNLEGKRQLGRPGPKREENIKNDVRFAEYRIL
jgi:hypothetical protein